MTGNQNLVFREEKDILQFDAQEIRLFNVQYSNIITQIVYVLKSITPPQGAPIIDIDLYSLGDFLRKEMNYKEENKLINPSERILHEKGIAKLWNETHA